MHSIKDRVDVGVVFKAGVIRPVWFVWSGIRHQIRDVTYSWVEKKGERRIFHFSVTDGVDLYELCFDPSSLMWHVIGVFV
jgi:hypothetical protein